MAEYAFLTAWASTAKSSALADDGRAASAKLQHELDRLLRKIVEQLDSKDGGGWQLLSHSLFVEGERLQMTFLAKR